MVPDTDASRIARLEQKAAGIEQRVDAIDYSVKVLAPVATQVGVQNVRIDNLDADVRGNHADVMHRLDEMDRKMEKDREHWQKKLEDKEAEQAQERRELSKERRDLRNVLLGLTGVIITAVSSGVVAILTNGGG